MQKHLSDEDMESTYELLAEVIDRAGESDEKLLLTKLCLTLAHKLGSLQEIKEAIATAEMDLH
jgi:hypothetical protein